MFNSQVYISVRFKIINVELFFDLTSINDPFPIETLWIIFVEEILL